MGPYRCRLQSFYFVLISTIFRATHAMYPWPWYDRGRDLNIYRQTVIHGRYVHSDMNFWIHLLVRSFVRSYEHITSRDCSPSQLDWTSINAVGRCNGLGNGFDDLDRPNASGNDRVHGYFFRAKVLNQSLSSRFRGQRRLFIKLKIFLTLRLPRRTKTNRFQSFQHAAYTSAYNEVRIASYNSHEEIYKTDWL